MKTPLQTTFRDVHPTPELEELILEQARKLESHCPELIGCRVAVDGPPRRHRQGGHYQVRIDVTIPGEELVVNRDPNGSDRHEQCDAAIRDTFKTARRMLEEHRQRRRDRNNAGETIADVLPN